MIFFLNSANRVYEDVELNGVASVLFATGIFNTQQTTEALWRLGGDFFIQADGATMALSANPGMATMRVNTGTLRTIIKEDVALTAVVSSNPEAYTRMDAAVLRVNQALITADGLNEAGSNAVSFVVVAGSSSDPLSDTDIAIALGGDPFIRLADIAVAPGATAITQNVVTDRRTMVKMSRAVKGAFDRVQLYSLTADPENLEAGDVWYNSTENILKMFDGTHKIALQTEAFDWGYYPPGGIYDNADKFEALFDNDGSNGTGSDFVFCYIDPIDSDPKATSMTGQVFKMPDIEHPLLRVKLGNPAHPVALSFKVYTADGSHKPDTLVETPDYDGSLPANDYVDIYLDGTLYTPGTEYVIVAFAPNLTFYDPDAIGYSLILTAGHDADDFFVGRLTTYDPTDNIFDPLSMAWASSITPTTHWVMSIQERTEMRIGQADASGKNYLVAQTFTSRSKDISGFEVTKGDDVGSPTGGIDISIYLADANNEPTGDVLASGTISETDWGGYSGGDKVVIPVSFDQLTVGETYVVVIDTEDHDSDNCYTVMFGTTTTGTAKRNTTSEGWVALNGDIFFGIQVSHVRKIVVTGDDGLIPVELLPVVHKRVTYITSSATPAIDTDLCDAVSITALGVAVTSFTTNLLGSPSDFDRLIVRIKDDGTNRALSWGSKFAAKGVALPTTTTAGKLTTVTLEYDTVTAKWGCIAAVTEA